VSDSSGWAAISSPAAYELTSWAAEYPPKLPLGLFLQVLLASVDDDRRQRTMPVQWSRHFRHSQGIPQMAVA
jgi:hypothetical protein